MVIYWVQHLTKFRYKPAVRESVMELRMQPRSEGTQRCLSFELTVKPSAVAMHYQDYMGNVVHHFDIAGSHSELSLRAHSVVEVLPLANAHDRGAAGWQELDAVVAAGDYWEMLEPSTYPRPTQSLQQAARQLKIERRATPLATLEYISQAIHHSFSYVPNSTKVDSPIDDALESRKGVCQDFAHIMIALVRELRIPCRYVSGYLFHGKNDRSTTSEGASHAWVEAMLPAMGWIGFDPTNDLACGERHIRVAVGRDYADVPPTRGLYKGGGESELSVAVTVALSDPATSEEPAPATTLRRLTRSPEQRLKEAQEQQQQ
ncbi:MAG: transglutaminase family protein [Acidobacteria bacterium]|nr:transglutaminase family protein [Acidobacteriota bacterium]